MEIMQEVVWMRISGRDVSRLYRSQHIGGVKDEGATGESRDRTDAVELSPEAKEVARALRTYEEIDIERRELVCALRERIAEGEYRVPAREIAEHIVRDGGFDSKA